MRIYCCIKRNVSGSRYFFSKPLPHFCVWQAYCSWFTDYQIAVCFSQNLATTNNTGYTLVSKPMRRKKTHFENREQEESFITAENQTFWGSVRRSDIETIQQGLTSRLSGRKHEGEMFELIHFLVKGDIFQNSLYIVGND